MRLSDKLFVLVPMLVTVLRGQTPDYPYVFKQIAGAFPLGDGGPAVQALLYNPVATQLDPSGNVYILDQSNLRIRKMAPYPLSPNSSWTARQIGVPTRTP